MWSSVAKVRSGIRTGTFSSRSAWNACGEVTSWIRWRPIRSWVCPEGSVRTVWASHTLSSSDDGHGFSSVGAECAAPRPLSIVKYSSRSRKVRYMIDAGPPPGPAEPAGRRAQRLGGRGGAPAAPHLLRDQPADPQAGAPPGRASLLERAGRGVRLTAAGEAALPGILQLGTETEAALRPARRAVRAPARDLAGGGQRLPRARACWCRCCASCSRSSRACASRSPPRTRARACGWSASGEVDCAVVTGQEAPRGIEAARLFDQPFVWVGPAAGRDVARR